MLDQEKLLAAALEFPPGDQRTAFVERSTEGRLELRVKLLRLLQINDDAGSFLELNARERDSTLVTADQVSAEAPGLEQLLAQLEPAGDGPGLGRLGHFRLVELLGEGGSAFVFRAVDEKLDREVAVKILRPGLVSTPRHRKKFADEARTIASLRAERIVSVYEVGEHHSLPFFVMEYLPNGSLQTHLSRNGPLNFADTVTIAKQVADGLAVAHARGLLHRDVKPSNVLVDRFPDRIKLSDFGLARSVMLEEEDRAIGTPQFSSPEQIRGEPVDQRTDLFGFGCLLYSLLVGQSPFAGSSRLRTIEMTLGMNVEPLSHFGLKVPDDFQRLLDRLLSKDPANRPASVEEVRSALDSFELSGSEPNANRRSWLLRAGALAAGGGLFFIWNRSQRSEPSGPVLPSSTPINLSLMNGGLDPFLHSFEDAVFVKSEPLSVPRGNHYWRPSQLGKTGTVTYRFQFDRPLQSCRIKAWAYFAYGMDPMAWTKTWVGSRENRLQTAVSLRYDRFEYWPKPGEAASLPLISTEDMVSFHGPNKWIDVSGIMKGAKTLFIRSELYSEYEVSTFAGVSLGPAAVQFLRTNEGYEQVYPLMIDPKG